MKKILFSLFIVFLIFSACKTVKNGSKASMAQGIIGTVSEIKGNQMPMKGALEPKSKGIAAWVLIYEATNMYQATTLGSPTLFTGIQTRQVASVQSDSTGKFSIALPPGKYSLFVKQDKGLYANLFDQFNQIALFEVLEGKITQANLLMNSAAKY